MKKIFLVYAVVVGVSGLLVSGCAHQSNETNGAPSENYKYLTGSYMPQDVQRNGSVSNGKSNVRVIDSSDLQESGGADVNQALRRLGANH
jgi:hypothetical protein